MADDSPEQLPPSPDPARARRAPPTIDLEASEVSGETRKATAEPEPEPGPGPASALPPKPEPPPERPSLGPMSFGLIAALTGAVAAALVIGAAWLAGWPGAPLPPPPEPVRAYCDTPSAVPVWV